MIFLSYPKLLLPCARFYLLMTLNTLSNEKISLFSNAYLLAWFVQ